jgi:hypothetical protein
MNDTIKKLKWENFRHNQKWRTWQGEMARRFVTGVGYCFLCIARKCFKWSLGRCSWCGNKTGCNGVVSSKGTRCMNGVCDSD